MLSPRGKKELKINQRRILINSIEIGIPAPEQVFILGQRHTSNGKVVGRVRNSKTLNYKSFTPHRDGLFCERIFGPVQSYICACGKQGPLTTSKGTLKFCPRCEVEYTDQRARRYRVGYIGLVSPVTHIWHLKGRPSYLSLFLGKRKKTLATLAYCNDYLVEQAFSKVDVNRKFSLGKQHRPSPSGASAGPLLAQPKGEHGPARVPVGIGADFFKNRILKGLTESKVIKGLTLSRQQERSKVRYTFRSPPEGAHPERIPETNFVAKFDEQNLAFATRKFAPEGLDCASFLKSLRLPRGSTTPLPSSSGFRYAKVCPGGARQVKCEASQKRTTLSYTRSQTLPFLPTFICEFHLRDGLLSFFDTFPPTEDIPIPVYCQIPRRYPLRDVHKFMADQAFSKVQVEQSSTKGWPSASKLRTDQRSETNYTGRRSDQASKNSEIFGYKIFDFARTSFDKLVAGQDLGTPLSNQTGPLLLNRGSNLPLRFPPKGPTQSVVLGATRKTLSPLQGEAELRSVEQRKPVDRAELGWPEGPQNTLGCVATKLVGPYGAPLGSPSANQRATKSPLGLGGTRTLAELKVSPCSASLRVLCEAEQLLRNCRNGVPVTPKGFSEAKSGLAPLGQVLAFGQQEFRSAVGAWSKSSARRKGRVHKRNNQLILPNRLEQTGRRRGFGLLTARRPKPLQVGRPTPASQSFEKTKTKNLLTTATFTSQIRVLGGPVQLCLPKREVGLINGKDVFHISIGTVNEKRLSLREVLLSLLLDRIVTTLIGLTPSLATYLSRPEPTISKPKVLVGAEPMVIMTRRIGGQVGAYAADETGTFDLPSRETGTTFGQRASSPRSVKNTWQKLIKGEVNNLRSAQAVSDAPNKTEGFVLASHVWTPNLRQGWPQKALKEISNDGKVKRLNGLLRGKRFTLAKPIWLLSAALSRPTPSGAIAGPRRGPERVPVGHSGGTAEGRTRSSIELPNQRNQIVGEHEQAKGEPTAVDNSIVVFERTLDKSASAPSLSSTKAERDSLALLLNRRGRFSTQNKSFYSKCKIVSEDLRFKHAKRLSLPVIGESPARLTIRLVFADGWSDLGSLSKAWLANPYRLVAGAGTVGQATEAYHRRNRVRRDRNARLEYISNQGHFEDSFFSLGNSSDSASRSARVRKPIKVSAEPPVRSWVGLQSNLSIANAVRFGESIEEWLEYWFDRWLQNCYAAKPATDLAFIQARLSQSKTLLLSEATRALRSRAIASQLPERSSGNPEWPTGTLSGPLRGPAIAPEGVGLEHGLNFNSAKALVPPRPKKQNPTNKNLIFAEDRDPKNYLTDNTTSFESDAPTSKSIEEDISVGGTFPELRYGWPRRGLRGEVERAAPLTNPRFVLAGSTWARKALEKYRGTGLRGSLTPPRQLNKSARVLRSAFVQTPLELANQAQDGRTKPDIFFGNEDEYGYEEGHVSAIDDEPEINRDNGRLLASRSKVFRTDSYSAKLSKAQLGLVEENATASEADKGGTDSYMKAQLDLQAIQEVLSYTGGGALRELLRCFDTQAFSVILLNEIKLLREYHKGYFLYEYDQVSHAGTTFRLGAPRLQTMVGVTGGRPEVGWTEGGRTPLERPLLGKLDQVDNAEGFVRRRKLNKSASTPRSASAKAEHGALALFQNQNGFVKPSRSSKTKQSEKDSQTEYDTNYEELPEEINRFSRAIHRNARRLKIVQLLMRNKRRPEWMLIAALPVLPPDLRPILQMSENLIVASDLNTLYQRVIYRNNRQYKLRIVEWSYATSLQRLVQDAVDRLIENGKGGSKPFLTPGGRPLKSLSDTLKGKKGRFRLNLLGKRVDFSGRSVIVVSPYLKIHECGLPREMALELYQYLLIRQMLLKRQVSSVILAKRVIRQQKAFVWDTLRDLIYHHPILLNRAPTLHRLGIQAFQPKLVLGSTILLHPLVCAGFNADFDGDQMGVHLPLCDEARAEAWDLLWSRNNLLSPATGEPILLPSQDMVLGFYHMTALLPSRYATSTAQSVGSARSIARSADKNERRRGSGFVQIDARPKVARTPFFFEKGLRKSHFFSPLDVVRAYQNGDLDIHTAIWLQWNGKIENNDSDQTPLEVRINSFGVSTQLYPSYKSRKDASSQSTATFNLFLRTTPGRVIVNNLFLAPTGQAELRSGLSSDRKNTAN